MALGRKVVDLVRLDVLDDADEAAGVGQIAVVQEVSALAKELRQQGSKIPIYTYSLLL